MSRSDHHVRSSQGSWGSGISDKIIKLGFGEGLFLKGEIGHMRHHVTKGMTSEDYTSQA